MKQKEGAGEPDLGSVPHVLGCGPWGFQRQRIKANIPDFRITTMLNMYLFDEVGRAIVDTKASCGGLAR